MKAANIIAISCLILGLISCVTAVALGGFDMGIFSTNQFTEGTETVLESFSNIRVDATEYDIHLALAEDETCRIECLQNVKMPLRIAVEDNALTVQAVNQKQWYDYISFFQFRHGKITVYLPASQYETVDLRADTGDIQIPAGFTFGDAAIHTSTGDITLESMTTVRTLEVKASTGYVAMIDISAATLSARVSTGRINAQNVTVAGQMDLQATTGDVRLTACNADTLEIETNTGNMVLQDIVSTGAMTLKASTGDVRLTACDAASLEITTSTGDVRGTLLTPKQFQANTSTGRVNVPSSATGGICRITCSTGDIDIRLS